MRCIWQKPARQSVIDIVAYIIFYYGTNAKKKFFAAVNRTIKLLSKQPNMGLIDPLFSDRSETYRSIIVGNRNKLVYYINNNTIQIVAFWDCRCDPEAQVKKIK